MCLALDAEHTNDHVPNPNPHTTTPPLAVLLTETCKLLICVAASLARSAREAEPRPLRALGGKVRASRPMLVPAACFVLQQLLLVLAATALDAVSFQVFQQSFKLVPTAVFAHLLLHQRLRPAQWASIPILAVGVVLVTTGGSAAPKASTASNATPYALGALACALSGLSSAYAGVHFEKYIKGVHRESLVVRNVQLGAFGVPLSLLVCALRDGRSLFAPSNGGPLRGFDALAWGVVVLQVFGGLAMGMVVKHCDNIVKNFALAISVVLTVLLSIPLFGQWPSPWFLAGVALIVLSVSMYANAHAGGVARLGRTGSAKRRSSDVHLALRELERQHSGGPITPRAQQCVWMGWCMCFVWWKGLGGAFARATKGGRPWMQRLRV